MDVLWICFNFSEHILKMQGSCIYLKESVCRPHGFLVVLIIAMKWARELITTGCRFTVDTVGKRTSLATDRSKWFWFIFV